MKKLITTITLLLSLASYSMEMHFPNLDRVIVSSSLIEKGDVEFYNGEVINFFVVKQNKKINALQTACIEHAKNSTEKHFYMKVASEITGKESLKLDLSEEECQKITTKLISNSLSKTKTYIDIDLVDLKINSISSDVPEINGVKYFTPSGSELINAKSRN